MVKSPASCLRIITCARGDPAPKDAGDLSLSENKSSGDKRGWSFRKKSGRQRGPSNHVTVSETQTTRTRETLESALLKSPSPDNNNVAEKPITSHSTDAKIEEKTELPVPHIVQPLEDKTELSVPSMEEETDHRTELPVIVELRGTETEDDLNVTEKETELHINPKETEAGEVTVVEKDTGSEVDAVSKFETQEHVMDDVIIIEKDNEEDKLEEKIQTNPKETNDGEATVVDKDMNSEVDVVSKTDDVIIVTKGNDDKLNESAIIIIQSAIRGFLVRRKCLKHKKAIKLQAAIRGHLVRRQAMGSLRCVQAIVKMQTLVRARQSFKDCTTNLPISGKTHGSSATSVGNLLQNKFARHLMEAAPKTRPITIKCDPKKPNSSWNWLERWMFVSPPEKTTKPELAVEDKQSETMEIVEACPEEASSPPVHMEPAYSELDTETKKKLLSDEESKIELHHVEQSEPDSLPKEEAESVNEEPKNVLKRKSSNPPFFDAQSKFEEVVVASSIGSDKDAVVAEGESETDRISPELSAVEDVVGTQHSERVFCETDDVKVTNIDVEEPKGEVEASPVLRTTPDGKKKLQLSPEASTPETVSQAETQASQGSSVKSKKEKTEKRSSSEKRKARKKTAITASPKQESGGTGGNNAEEEVKKENRSGRRRDSFGLDQELRDGSGGKSPIPRFMQPTESARAKLQEQNSPRSSPDVTERDSSAKKRDSLSGPNGKLSTSPRIQRPAAQAAKERKWQR